MISWEEYQSKGPSLEAFTNKKKTDIQCPECGEPLYKRMDIVLTTYPAQYQYECDKCGWVGYAYV